MTDAELLDAALAKARDTRALVVESGALRRTPETFRTLFGDAPALVIADSNTFAVAGRQVTGALGDAGTPCREPLVLDARGLYAEYGFVDQVRSAIAGADATPIAVGSGSINDLTKLAAHQCGRQYLSVATAASMDGYTAFGASITHQGSKQTFDCPAPLGVVADLDVIAAAPEGLNASGYADLVAKCPAGADWIIADAVGVDPIDPENWDMVQSRLRYWMADPAGMRRGDLEAVRRLTVALMITGFAMQAACSSRPVSGAEHQFSHLWDMEHHTHRGVAPSHGFKVGVGTLASLALYEFLMNADIAGIDVDAAADAWPDAAANEREIAALFPIPELADKARLESGVKYISREELHAQLPLIKQAWPAMRERLADHLIPQREVRDMLAAAGCPTTPEDIGLSRERFRDSFLKAYHIRRRFTIFDLLRRLNLWDQALDHLFKSRQYFA